MRPNLITRLKEEWNNLDPVDPLRGLIADAIDALAEQLARQQEIDELTAQRDKLADILTDALAKAKAEEREACAQVCDEIWQEDGTAFDCRESIRTRGDA